MTYREGLARIRERRPFQYLELLAFVGALGAAGERRQVDRLRRRYRELLDQLAPDGIMILPVGGDEEDQQLLKCRRRGDSVEYETLWPVRFVPLLPDAVDDSGA